MYVYIHVHTHIYIHTYIHINSRYIHIYLYVYIYNKFPVYPISIRIPYIDRDGDRCAYKHTYIWREVYTHCPNVCLPPICVFFTAARPARGAVGLRPPNLIDIGI